MNGLSDKLERLNGEELRDLTIQVEKLKEGTVEIAGPISKDYEKYQLKNHPDTVDIAVTVVMGAPFEEGFRDILGNVTEVLRRAFEHYKVKLNIYKDYHLHATISPLIRTTFDPEIYSKDPETTKRIQREEIENRSPDLQEIEKEIDETQPFSIEFCTWDIRIGGRGEILLWGHAKDDEGKKKLEGLRKRLRKIAGPHARDKGSKVHIALATIQDFHKLTGLEKKEIAREISDKLKSIPVPNSILIDRVRFVEYMHRSLSRVNADYDYVFKMGSAT